MKIRDLVKLCLFQFSRRDKRTLYIISVLQAALNLLDILAITLIGVIGALGVSYVAGFAIPEWVLTVLGYLKLNDFSIEQTLFLVSALTAFLFVTKSISSVFINFRVFRFLSIRQAAISTKISNQLSEAPYQFIKKQNPQNMIYAVTDGVNNLVIGVLGNFFIAIAEFLLLFLIVLLLFILNPLTAIFTLVFFGLIAFLLHKVLGSVSIKYGNRFSSASISGRSQISTLLYAYKEILVFGRSEFFTKRFHETRHESALTYAMGIWLQQMPKYIFEITLILGAAGIVGFQVLQNNATGGISILIVFLASATRLTPALMRLQVALLQLRNYQPGAMITLELISQLNDLSNKIAKHEARYTLICPPKIEFKNVNFRYQDGESETITDVSLTIPAKKVTAFAGVSGSGKTTLIDLLLGIYSPNSGEIIFHENEVEVQVNKVYGVAYVPQNPFIIDGTLTENIAIGIPSELIDEAAIDFAINASGLKLVIDSLPNGIDTNLGGLASRLSGGEKQRIAIARALYVKPKLLVIDEATSALDGVTEQYITDSIFALTDDMTVVLIAHRLSSIKNAHVIYYMNNGLIKGSGRFDELRSKLPEFAEQVRLMNLDK
jgi:ABC-type multidrug transport system fused ATPase/permease subunit